MGYTKDLWTRPGPDGKRVPSERHGKGKRWLACWRDPDGRERSKAFTNKKASELHWQKQEVDVERGDYHDPKAGRELFGDVAKRWLGSRSVDPNSRIRYDQCYRNQVAAVFGHRQVQRIKASEVQEFLAGLGERLGPSTVSIARLIVQGALELALADELVRKNVARSSIISTARPPREKVVAWGDADVLGLIDAHPEPLRILPIVGAGCGLREGELFAIDPSDVDFDAQVLHVRRQVKRLSTRWVYALPKNDGERDVPLPDWVAQSIRVHMASHKPSPVSLPWEKVDGPTRTHQLIVIHPDGGHLKHLTYDRYWKPALHRAGIIGPPGRDESGGLVYPTTGKEGRHALRHYYASVQLADGTAITSLAEYLGHHDPGYTLRTYGHLQPDSHERARKAIDARFFRPRAVSDGTMT